MRSGPFLATLVLLGCPKRVEREAAAQEAAVVAPIDAAWERRGGEGLEPVRAALEAVPSPQDHLPGVLWRRARLEVAASLLEDETDEARRVLARARGAAMTCLHAERAVAQAITQGRPDEGVAALTPERRPCAAWAGQAWARWLALQPGAGAALDVPLVRALLDADRDEDDPEAALRRVWGHTLVALAVPGEDTAGDLATLAAPSEEGAWIRHEDVRRLAPDTVVPTPTNAADTPEERASARRLGERP